MLVEFWLWHWKLATNCKVIFLVLVLKFCSSIWCRLQQGIHHTHRHPHLKIWTCPRSSSRVCMWRWNSRSLVRFKLLVFQWSWLHHIKIWLLRHIMVLVRPLVLCLACWVVLIHNYKGPKHSAFALQESYQFRLVLVFQFFFSLYHFFQCWVWSIK